MCFSQFCLHVHELGCCIVILNCNWLAANIKSTLISNFVLQTNERNGNELFCIIPVQDRSDGVMETQLFLKQVVPQSFRAYTLVAENSISANTAKVKLIQSKFEAEHK